MVQRVKDDYLKRELDKHNAIYNGLIRQIEKQNKKGDPEKTLKLIRCAAQFAVSVHVGRYADGKIENIALGIGKRLDQVYAGEAKASVRPDLSASNKSFKSQVLHVATKVYSTGGHTRLIENWIANHPGIKHSLVLSEQGDVEVPGFIKKAVYNTGGSLINLSSEASLIEKSALLREIANSEADYVVIHHHPDDVVPIVAFAVEGCPPVAVMNHADHIFWLGTSIADLVINFRDYAAVVSEKRRFARLNLLLPIPLSFPTPHLTRHEARRKLGITDEDTVLLSIGSAYKYRPNSTHNFFTTVGKILSRNPSTRVYLVGPEQSDYFEYLGETERKRMYFLGLQDDTYLYKLAADIYLEGFPFASFTALLEAAAMGVCPVLMYAPPPEMTISEDVGLKGIVDNSKTEEEYVCRVNRLIQDPHERLRIGSLVRNQVTAYHIGEKWRDYLKNIVSSLERSRHAPALIPRSTCIKAREDLNQTELNLSKLRKIPLLLEMCWQNFREFNLGDVIGLFMLSLKTGDTKWASRHSLVWVATVKSKFLDSVLNSGNDLFSVRLASNLRNIFQKH